MFDQRPTYASLNTPAHKTTLNRNRGRCSKKTMIKNAAKPRQTNCPVKPEAYSESSQRSELELFEKITYRFLAATFAKSSKLDIWLGFECASENCKVCWKTAVTKSYFIEVY